MRILRRVLLVVLVLLVVGAVGGYLHERPLLLTGTGYAAHNACALEHLQGRSDAATDLPPNPLVPLLRTSASGDSTRSTVLGALSGQTAYFTPGYGCTVGRRPSTLPTPSRVDPAHDPLRAQPTPHETAAVRAALAQAFGDDLGATARRALGTRGIVVVHRGRIVGERYATGFGPTTPQLGWSMTKSVADLLVGRLVQQHAVALSDDHLRPEWSDGRSAITVRDLLTMTSGLSWDETYSLGTPITRMLYLEPDMGSYVASRPLAHRPGTRQYYSSGDTDLLCSVLLAKAARAGLGGDADLPRRQVLAPLGMASATLEPDGAGTPVCSSYLWATPREWAAVGLFALRDGVWDGRRLLPSGWMARATKALPVPTSDPGYAEGWWSNRAADGHVVEAAMPADAYSAEGHDGQWVVVVPSADLVVARLGFTPTAKDDRVPALVGALVRAVGGRG